MYTIKFQQAALPVLLSALFLSGCNLPRTSDSNTQQQGDLQNNLVGVSLVAAESTKDLENYLKQGLLEATNESAVYNTLQLDAMDMQFNPAVTMTNNTLETAGAAATAGVSSDQISATNLQVSGVDEADLVKSDGKHLYIIDRPDGNRLHYSVRIMTINPAPAEAVEINRLTLDEAGTQIAGLYLYPGQDTNDDLLVAVGSQPWNWQYFQSPWNWQQGAAKIWLYNVTDPENVTPPLMLSLDGYILSSRRIGDMLYLVSRFTPQIDGLYPYPATDIERAQNKLLVDNAHLADMLPGLAWNTDKAQAYIESSNCFLPNTTTTYKGLPTLTTITALNLRNPTSIKSVCFGGNATGFYASPESIYITNTFGLRRFAEIDVLPAVEQDLPATMTVVHKFSLTTDGPLYTGSGAVPGRLAGGSNPSYLMAEREGYLNILTSWFAKQQWRHQLTVLQETSDPNSQLLETVARLPNRDQPQAIGKPGEQIYATRYLGQRAYIVTFKKIDPLYVIDLHNQQAPAIAGELEMPGYSSHIHPIGDNLILGIGKEAVPSTSGDFAWYQGLKLALFDVSDMTAPTEVSTVTIGDRGTSSALLHDFHALAYVPNTNGTAHRLALPVKLHEYLSPPLQPWEFAPWTQTGLHLFDINDGSDGQNPVIKPAGIIVAVDQNNVDLANEANVLDVAIPAVTNTAAFAPATSYRATMNMFTYDDRAVLQGPAVHYIHHSKVWSAPWDNPDGAYANQ